MKLSDIFNRLQISHNTINDATLSFKEADKDAAWELYIELITRVSTQNLNPEEGDEAAALESIYKIFDITRQTIKNHGYNCIEISKIAILVLNKVIRPFTSKWHKVLVNNKLPEKSLEFRRELTSLQITLKEYSKILSEILCINDLTDLLN